MLGSSGAQRVSPARCVPSGWRRGPREEAAVPLPVRLSLHLSRGSHFPCSGPEASSHPATLLPPPPPRHVRPEPGKQYGTSFLLHRLGPCEGRERSHPRGPPGRTSPPTGTPVPRQDSTGGQAAPHLPEVPAGGRGPARAPGRSSCSPGLSPTDQWCSGPPAARGTRTGETTHPSDRHCSRHPQVGHSWENSSGEKRSCQCFPDNFDFSGFKPFL